MRYRVSEDAERDLDEIFLYWAYGRSASDISFSTSTHPSLCSRSILSIMNLLNFKGLIFILILGLEYRSLENRFPSQSSNHSASHLGPSLENSSSHFAMNSPHQSSRLHSGQAE